MTLNFNHILLFFYLIDDYGRVTSKFLRTITMKCFKSSRPNGAPIKSDEVKNFVECSHLRKGGKRAWEHKFCTQSDTNTQEYGTCVGDGGGKLENFR